MTIKKSPSLLGGAMIIAGTAIGAGMLANPTSTAGVWFIGSILALVYTWFCMTTSGLMILEANLHYPTGSSFDTIVKDLLGKGWNIINGLSVAFVLYILTYAYITSGGGDVALSFTPHDTQSTMTLNKQENNWATSAAPKTLSYVTTFTVQSSTVTTTTAEINKKDNIGDTEVFAGSAEFPVKWSNPSQVPQLTIIPLRYEITWNGKSYQVNSTKDEGEEGTYSAHFTEANMLISADDTQEEGKSLLRIEPDGNDITAGVYQFSVFAPDANGGEIQQNFTLIVTEENSSKTETSTAITSIAPAAFGDTLTLTATVTANNTPVSDPTVEYYINGKRINSNSVSVTPGSGFKLGSNELRAIYPGSDTHAVSVGTANVTVSKATDASIHGFQVPTGGTFNGTVNNTGTITGGVFNGTVTGSGTISWERKVFDDAGFLAALADSNVTTIKLKENITVNATENVKELTINRPITLVNSSRKPLHLNLPLTIAENGALTLDGLEGVVSLNPYKGMVVNGSLTVGAGCEVIFGGHQPFLTINQGGTVTTQPAGENTISGLLSLGKDAALTVNGARYDSVMGLRASGMFIDTSLALIATAIAAVAFGAIRNRR